MSSTKKINIINNYYDKTDVKETNSWAHSINNVGSNTDTDKLNPLQGKHIKLLDVYTLWTHDIYDKDWTIKGYKKRCTLETVSDFWKLFNNFNKLGMKYNHYLLVTLQKVQ